MITETEAILALGQKQAHIVKSSDGLEYLVVPDGYTSHMIASEGGLRREEPRYVKQSVTLHNVDSFVDYIMSFIDENEQNTVLFADVFANKIIAQIDYHRGVIASNMAHRATLELAMSEEVARWSGISGRLMSQLEFASFLEENGCDVRAPSGAELLECVRDFHSHRKVSFRKAVRTASGAERFEYSEEISSGSKTGSIETPNKFLLSMPIYYGESDVELHAFLRWALDSDAGKLQLGIELHRIDYVRQAVFRQIVIGIQERTKCVTVFGRI